jgi:nicotinate-nucleotide adenylyltransferase
MVMKLALYGGSFDPPHKGHVSVALKAVECLECNQLLIVPAFRNPLKSSIVADGDTRLRWLREIFAPYSRIAVSDFEIKHHRSVYTIETVRHYAPLCDTLYLVIGADNLESLHLWHEYETLKTLVTFVVATRNAIPIPKGMIALVVNEPISSTDFRISMSPLGLPERIENEITSYYKEHYEPTN